MFVTPSGSVPPSPASNPPASASEPASVHEGPATGATVLRTALPDLAAHALRVGISDGRWSGFLPGENELCRDLRVGRESLRKALARLAAEGLISLGGRGRRHRIEQARASLAAPNRGRVIRMLTPFPCYLLGESHLAICESLRESAEKAGYTVEMEHRPRLYRSRDAIELGRLNALPDTAGWVVLFSTAAIQQTLVAHRIPALLIGPPLPGLRIPAIWPDSAAAARHAAGLFHARGHRSVLFLQSTPPTQGSRRAENAFIAESRRLGIRPRSLTLAALNDQWHRPFDSLMGAHPRPTAILGCGSHLSLRVLCHLQSRGLRVPGDVSLVSLWADGFMHYTEPALTHYQVDNVAVGRKALRLLVHRIERGPVEDENIVLIPEFVPGGSVGPAPERGPRP